MGTILENEEKIEDVKSCLNYTSLDTNVTLNIKRDNSSENNKELTNSNENNKKKISHILIKNLIIYLYYLKI